MVLGPVGSMTQRRDSLTTCLDDERIETACAATSSDAAHQIASGGIRRPGMGRHHKCCFASLGHAGGRGRDIKRAGTISA